MIMKGTPHPGFNAGLHPNDCEWHAEAKLIPRELIEGHLCEPLHFQWPRTNILTQILWDTEAAKPLKPS